MNKRRSPLNYLAPLGILVGMAIQNIACQSGPVDGELKNDIRALQQFDHGITAYLTLHDRVEKTIPQLESADSGANIVRHERVLATKVQASRIQSNPREGSIFTPEVSAYIRRQIEAAYIANGEAIQATLELAPSPTRQNVAVNQLFPENWVLSIMPPTILLRLPRLPELIQYQIVNRDLVIRDIECNFVVDVMRNAIPDT